MPASEPRIEAADRLLEREPSGRDERVPAVPERLEDVRERRQEEALDVESAHEPLPQRDPDHEHEHRGQPVARAPADAVGERPARQRLRRPWGRCSCLDLLRHTASAPPGAQELAHLRHELEEARVLARLDRPRPRQVDGTTSAIRPGRGDMTTTRVERKTASAIECVTKRTRACRLLQMRRSSMFRRSLVISSSAPNGSSISSSAGSKESARAIADPLLHAARELPGVVALEAGELDEPSISSTRSARALAVPAEHLERQRDVLRDRAPVVEHGVLEDDPVVAVDPRLARRLPVDDDLAAVGSVRSPTIRSSVDFPQPDGPIRETNSPASTSRSMPSSATTRRVRTACVTSRGARPPSWAAASGGHANRSGAGGGRRASRRPTTTRKNEMPSAAAISSSPRGSRARRRSTG